MQKIGFLQDGLGGRRGRIELIPGGGQMTTAVTKGDRKMLLVSIVLFISISFVFGRSRWVDLTADDYLSVYPETIGWIRLTETNLSGNHAENVKEMRNLPLFAVGSELPST